MKYYILAACIALMGAVAVWVSQKAGTTAARDEKADWKYYAVETETSVRPKHFEEMKWSPEAAVELRAPASEKKKKNKN